MSSPAQKGGRRPDGMPVGKPFVKGQPTINPGGRPAVLAELRDICRAHTEKAIKALVECLDSDNEQVRIKAAEALLDRGYGRPTQPITTDSERELSRLTTAELLARNAEVAAALAEAAAKESEE